MNLFSGETEPILITHELDLSANSYIVRVVKLTRGRSHEETRSESN